MKKTLLALVLVLGFSTTFVSCEKYDDTELRTRLDKLENSTIASINQQISGILSSISSLEGVDAELKKTITELQNKDGDFEKEIAKLKEYDTSLEKKIDDLKDYVDKELSANKDWANATFSTLAQYNTTCDELAKIKESITKLKDELTTAISDAIAASETSIKKWVNEQLTGYWTIAEAQAKLDELKDAQADEIKKVKQSIEEAKKELTDAYTAAIKEAIEQSEGKLSKQIEEVNKALEEKIGKIEERLAAIEEQLKNLLRDFNITFDDNEIGILAGGSTTVGYTIVGATEKTTVKALGQNGWSAKVTPNGTDKGTITVKAPNPLTEDEIIVLVYDGEYRTIMSSLNFVSGVVSPAVSAKEIDSDGGTVDISVSSNMRYNVKIPADCDWISQVETKAMRTDVLTFLINANVGSIRKATVSFTDDSGQSLSSIAFVQQGAAVEITLSEAGTLLEAIGEDVYKYVKGLTITGPINGTDILTIRRMENLHYLNIENASIVAGGVSYYDNYKTQDNILNSFTFIYDTSLEEVILPKNITAIRNHAFMSCSNIKRIVMPNTVTFIDTQAFDGCGKLTTINLSSAVTSLGTYAFSWCSSLKDITFPEGLTSIGNMAFYSSGLTKITLPSTIQSLGEYSFNCALTEIHMKANPANFTNINSVAFGPKAGTIYQTAKLYIPKGTRDAYMLTPFGEFVNIIEE